MMPAAQPGAWTLSVDFGTSFTVAATAGRGATDVVYFGHHHKPTMPSGVFADPDGSLLTGDLAANKRQLDPDLYVATPKRLLGAGARTIPLPSGPLSLARVVSAVIGEAASRAGQQHDGTVPAGTVVTHPAGWDSDLQRVLVTAAREAGLAQVRVLAEPVAAALHLGRGGGEPGDHIAVYDLGGGTFDAAVLRRTTRSFEVVATGGQTSIGGEWFDELLRQQLDSGPLGQIGAWRRLSGPPPDKELDFDAYVAWRNKVELLKENICFTKEVLSQQKSWGLIIPDYADSWAVTRELLESVLREPLTLTVDVLASTVAAAGLTPDQLSAVYLVGGASRIPLVRELLSERFPRKAVNQKGDPQTVVALGAAGGWEFATDIDGTRQVPVRWQSRLALAPTASLSSIRVVEYEAGAPPYFGIVARKQKDAKENFGAFVAAMEQREREAGWTLSAPKAVSIGGAEFGLTQQQWRTTDDQLTMLTRVYAVVSTLLVTAWARGNPTPAAAPESLTVDFRTAGSAEQLTLGMVMDPWVGRAVRERMIGRGARNGKVPGWAITVWSGPLLEGASTPEQLTERRLEELRKDYPKIGVRAAAPDVFLNSRLCVHQVIAVPPKGEEHWWTGIADGRFVRIVVAGLHPRWAEKYRDLVTLR